MSQHTYSNLPKPNIHFEAVENLLCHLNSSQTNHHSLFSNKFNLTTISPNHIFAILEDKWIIMTNTQSNTSTLLSMLI